MLRFLLHPRWLAWHGALVVVLVAFTLLGRWQLDSFEHHAKARADPGTVGIDAVTRPGGRLTGDDIARRVRVSGTYDAARTLLVPGRELDGREGFLVVTPLRSAAGIVPVLRGWVAGRRSPAVSAPDGSLEVTGRLQASESSDASAVDPLGPLPSNEVPYISTVSLLDVWPYPSNRIYDGYVVLGREGPAADTAPATVEAQQPSGGVGRWRNLAYALQWWLFAGAAVFFWATVIRRAYSERGRPRDDPSQLIMH